MKKSELQEIGREILKTRNELLEKNRNKWELGRYSLAQAYEDAIKEVCLL